MLRVALARDDDRLETGFVVVRYSKRILNQVPCVVGQGSVDGGLLVLPCSPVRLLARQSCFPLRRLCLEVLTFGNILRTQHQDWSCRSGFESEVVPDKVAVEDSKFWCGMRIGKMMNCSIVSSQLNLSTPEVRMRLLLLE